MVYHLAVSLASSTPLAMSYKIISGVVVGTDMLGHVEFI